jgi:NADPH-dependent 2,4-dienoyl-CoA reductase/sulfur reductase-like enzyme
MVGGFAGGAIGGGRVAETGDVLVASTGDVSAAELGSLTFEVRGAEGGAAAVDEGAGSLPHPNVAAVGDAAVPLDATEVCLE